LLLQAGAYAPDPVDVLVVCLLLAVLYAALARRSWYLRHRSSISLVLRVVRCGHLPLAPFLCLLSHCIRFCK
jgi:hypothetical protein